MPSTWRQKSVASAVRSRWSTPTRSEAPRCGPEPKQLNFTVREELLDDGNVTGWIRNILKLQTDIVVIDTRSGLDKTFETAVFISDLVVVPCGPSSLDILSARRTVMRTRELAAANANQHTRSLIVPTRVDFSSEEGRQITAELENITDLMGPLLSYDMDFVRSFAVGRSVAAFSPGRPADIEVRTLTAFVLKKLYMNPW